MWALLGCLGWAALTLTAIWALSEIGTPAWVYGALLIALFFTPGVISLIQWYKD